MLCILQGVCGQGWAFPSFLELVNTREHDGACMCTILAGQLLLVGLIKPMAADKQ